MNYLLLDLDGVILDSEQRVVNEKNKCPNVGWDDFFNTLDWYSLLAESEPINDSVDIIKSAQKRDKEIAILTKVHTLLEMQAKVYDMHRRGIFLPMFFVPPHVKKSEIFLPKNNEILVDDSLKNLHDWNLNGGTSILFASTSSDEVPYECINSLKRIL